MAFFLGVRTTGDLDWPNEHDLYRDMASAQGLLRQGYGHDPYYRGESVWYNPLAALAVAAAQRVTDLPLEVVVTRCGAYLNLLGPILFFALVAFLFDRWTALLALAGFLFCVGGRYPSWAAATYSPWLYPTNFAQGFFYLLMVALAALRGRAPGWRWALLAGALWGVTFLTHAAPAVLFGAMAATALAAALFQARNGNAQDRGRLLLAGILLTGVFAAVTYPFTRSILGHYGMQTANAVPGGFVADFLGYRRIPEMIWRHVQPPVLVAWFGLYLVARGRAGDPWVRRVLLCWIAWAAALVLYGYLVAGLAKLGIRLPSLVPSFHFFFYFHAALNVFFGVGALALARALVTRFARPPPRAGAAWARRAGLALALGLVAWSWPAYRARYDFAPARAEALGHGADEHRVAAYRWTREHTAPDDVFLASDHMAIFVLAPAGAKVVAVNPYFSNPYVDWDAREQARTSMFELLRAGRWDAFAGLAAAYHVSYVAGDNPDTAVAPSLLGRELQPVFASGTVTLYRITGR